MLAALYIVLEKVGRKSTLQFHVGKVYEIQIKTNMYHGEINRQHPQKKALEGVVFIRRQRIGIEEGLSRNVESLSLRTPGCIHLAKSTASGTARVS